MKNYSDGCLLCGHPLQGEIDSMIQRLSTEDAGFVEALMDDKGALGLLNRVNALIDRVYGDSSVDVTMQCLRAHAINHPLITPEGEIVVAEDTQMVRVGDRYLTIPTLRQGVVAVMALGLENVRLNPASIKPHHLIEVMRLAKQLGMTLGQEELDEILRNKISKPKVREEYAGPMAPPTTD